MNEDTKIKDFITRLANNFYDKEKLEGDEQFQKVLKLYRSNYRHSYSDMLTTLTEIQEKENDNSGIGILSGNLEMIKADLIPDKKYTNVNKKLYKFYDHMVLAVDVKVVVSKSVKIFTMKQKFPSCNYYQ